MAAIQQVPNLTVAEYNLLRAKQTTEAGLQREVIARAELRRWMSYHTHDSRRSNPGYPDLHLVHPGAGLSLFLELKTHTGRVRPEQRTWIDALRATGHRAYLVRPLDLFEGTVDHLLDPRNAATWPGETA
ncbi:VRR-NUC domain-containing protein [Rathayibacter sp. VKM Ac-2803]|uniref:VRR-NUC domain-containing protein n=1 Tax=Rathayibacter sp. VKM Ac-2803 TaxID=2609256 RepID=UPI00135CDAD3|nr:VRR-NUC domain-containing protein [Rathayibacter sp. VKM Ac-2803]MWV50091.1 VRR-NUC domain-containing protein [Rathayibacter sp. VKM Ac-2803]